MKYLTLALLASSLSLASMANDSTLSITDEIIGCFKSEVIMSEKKRFKKQVEISSKKILIVKSGVVINELGFEDPTDVRIYIGQRGAGRNGLSSSRVDESDDKQLDWYLKSNEIVRPKNLIHFLSISNQHGVFFVKENENSVKAIVSFPQYNQYGIDGDILKCSNDLSQVQKWAQELKPYNPLSR